MYMQETKSLEKTSTKLLLMFGAVLVSKDQRTEHEGGIVTKTSPKGLNEEGKDTFG